MQTSRRRQLANAIRALAMDAVQKANSGHPGMPMGMADIAQVLWGDHLRHNPGNPQWPERDRFVVSNGHGSMLLYALLHLTGYPLTIEDIKAFRQLGSHTAGHPEHDLHLGIETTTGPLGQGIANAVGMAIAEKWLAATFNRPGFDVVDHRTWVFLGDGCLMEGISHEACALAGTLKLGKLVAFYDDNGISIDGEVQGWFTDDTPQRFEAYGWHVVREIDGHNPAAVQAAISEGLAQKNRPTLICCRTIIGFGAPNKQGTEATHGAALGADEVAAARRELNWPAEPFVIPDDIRKDWDARERGAALEAKWREKFAAYRTAFPDLAAEYERRMKGELPAAWRDIVKEYVNQTAQANASLATRQASQQALNAFGPRVPELFGGSADLTGSNNTNRKDSKPFSGDDPSGNYLHYGVREFGMAAAMNGMALHGGVIPYGGVPGVHRLRTQCAAHVRADEAARDLCDDARFDRAGRGRSDASAGRASAELAHHPADDRMAAVRCHRDRASLGRRDRTQRRPDRAGSNPAGPARAVAHGRADRRDPPRRIHPEGLRGHAGRDSHRHGLRGRSRGRGGAPAATKGSARACSFDALHEPVRCAG
jgi:transketolase